MTPVRARTTAALTAKFAPARDFEREIAVMLEAAGAHNEQAVAEAEEALALKVEPGSTFNFPTEYNLFCSS